MVALSFSITDEKLRKQVELLSSPAKQKINSLKELHKAKIPTALFISPIFPQITDWVKMINKTKSFVDEYWFENLNLYPSIKGEIFNFLRKNKPELIEKYKEIYSKNSNYWNIEENKIIEFCKKNKVIYKIYFHHKRNDA